MSICLESSLDIPRRTSSHALHSVPPLSKGGRTQNLKILERGEPEKKFGVGETTRKGFIVLQIL